MIAADTWGDMTLRKMLLTYLKFCELANSQLHGTDESYLS